MCKIRLSIIAYSGTFVGSNADTLRKIVFRRHRLLVSNGFAHLVNNICFRFRRKTTYENFLVMIIAGNISVIII